MNRAQAMRTMSALSQPVRFDVYRRLVAALPGGIAAGELAQVAKIAPSAMSAHLAILSRAGLVTSSRVGRHVVYRAAQRTLDGLVVFLQSVGSPASEG